MSTASKAAGADGFSYEARRCFRCLLLGESLNGELKTLQEPWSAMAKHLNDRPPEEREGAFNLMLLARPDRDELVKAIAATGPDAEPPPEEPLRPATLADIRRGLSDQQWLWNGYIPAARLFGIAALEGIGKTRFLLDLARRIWHAEPWPDNQPATFPAGTPTLWVCADGQHDDIAQVAPQFGIPDEAIILNTPWDEPYGGNDIDDPDALIRLETFIEGFHPGMVFIDTLTFATARDLCRANEVMALGKPLDAIAKRTRTTIGLSLHLSREGKALGRRIRGLTRVLLHLECPDPEHHNERLRLWADKTFDKPPPVLGVTMTATGNTYDHTPPAATGSGGSNRMGRPPDARGKAEEFIRDALIRQNNRIGNDLAAEFVAAGLGSESTFWRAVKAMAEAGEVARDGGPGTGKQIILHLIAPRPDAEPDEDPDRPY